MLRSLSKKNKKIVFGITVFTAISTLYVCIPQKEHSKLAGNSSLMSFKGNTKNTNISTPKSEQTIVVTGTSDDAGVFERPNFLNNTYLFGKPHQDIEKTIQNDSITFVLKNIEKPLYMEFSPSGDENFFSSRIFIQPTDTVKFEIKNNVLRFTGKNAAQNNLYAALEAQTPDYSRFPYNGNLFLYKNGIQSIYEQKQAFLEKYQTENSLSPEFVAIFKKHLKFEYVDNLVSPRTISVQNGKFYVNDYDALPSLIEKEYGTSEVPFNLASYLDNITVNDFQDFSAMRHTDFLKNSLTACIRHYFVKTNAPYFSKEYFIAEKEFIETNFSGEIRDYALGRMIVDYYNKGFAFGLHRIQFMQKNIDEYMASVEGKTTHIKAMETIQKDINTYDFKLSESALNAKMINHLGDTITLQSIFDRSHQRVKVIDFWASWCPPCIKQIKENKPFKDRLSVENNVEWIYLSIDSDKEKWLAKQTELSETLHFRNSYLLLKGNKSSLAKALNVQQIPRYLIVNQQNKVVVNNAPSPNNEAAFEKIVDEIKPSALLTYRE
ncbi:redoxin family protein [Kordia sp. TARA_039_SRF]|nr:redoxin family protein [Kordia sp. TARA_039_SRF]